MKTVKIVFGEEAVQNLLNGIRMSKQELKNVEKQYQFDSEKEAEAFIQGIEEAVGWQEVYVLKGGKG